MGIEAFSSEDNESPTTSSENYNEESSDMSTSGSRFYSKESPHVPPAVDCENKETIYFELIDDKSIAVSVAESMGWRDANLMDKVAHFIRYDFREFFLPMNSSCASFDKALEDLKDRHLYPSRKYNDDVDYNPHVKSLDLSNDRSDSDSEEDGEVDWVGVMESNNTEEEGGDTSIEDDLEEAFD